MGEGEKVEGGIGEEEWEKGKERRRIGKEEEDDAFLQLQPAITQIQTDKGSRQAGRQATTRINHRLCDTSREKAAAASNLQQQQTRPRSNATVLPTQGSRVGASASGNQCPLVIHYSIVAYGNNQRRSWMETQQGK